MCCPCQWEKPLMESGRRLWSLGSLTTCPVFGGNWRMTNSSRTWAAQPSPERMEAEVFAVEEGGGVRESEDWRVESRARQETPPQNNTMLPGAGESWK